MEEYFINNLVQEGEKNNFLRMKIMNKAILKANILSVALISANVFADIPTPGKYQIFFDWGCDGSYSNTTLTLKSNGTFTVGDSSSVGKWVESHHSLTFEFPNGVFYTGYHAGKAVVGVSGTMSSLNGCFYYIKENNKIYDDFDNDENVNRNLAGEVAY
ncbi:hypothetical protein [Zooshikella ganghwensis]|uniref:Uncharacterized protein n=1 Tax=Zooshikella ganghwensis TaxID=202772 RepID=A0A4P9VRZ4_9GAMM|nr:hypothetical protein [Zooshikella ganghwensis]RDH45569.1 hypothetical protein B9G39_20105 [Zooshikella ganghwensis]